MAGSSSMTKINGNSCTDTPHRAAPPPLDIYYAELGTRVPRELFKNEHSLLVPPEDRKFGGEALVHSLGFGELFSLCDVWWRCRYPCPSAYQRSQPSSGQCFPWPKKLEKLITNVPRCTPKLKGGLESPLLPKIVNGEFVSTKE